jgi:hypothetical protein
VKKTWDIVTTLHYFCNFVKKLECSFTLGSLWSYFYGTRHRYQKRFNRATSKYYALKIISRILLPFLPQTTRGELRHSELPNMMKHFKQGTLSEGEAIVHLTSLCCLVSFNFANIINFFTKQDTLIWRSTVLSLSVKAMFPVGGII